MSDQNRSSDESIWPPGLRLIDDPQSSLDEIQTLADEWITDNIHRFDPFDWTALEERTLKRKSFTEFALNLYVAKGVSDTYPSSDPHDLVIDRVNDRRYRHLIRRNPRDFLKFSYPLTYAKTSGSLNDETASAVESVLDQPTVWSVERVPFRLMDLWHFCRIYGYEESPLEKDAILSLGSLNHPPNIANATLSDLYAITHNLYYYHNFGVDHPSFPGDIAPYDVKTVLVGGILRYIAADNCDIVLELLLAGVLQRQLPPGLVCLALAWVHEAASRSGYIPGPDEEPAEIPSSDLDSWGPDDREWARHYHTNLVGATATRVVEMRTDWSELARDREGESRQPSEWADLLRLGQLLDTLSQYNLELAARQLNDLAETTFRDPYSAVFEASATYLGQQKTQSGQYGFWTDEEALYSSHGKSRDAFREQMVQPVTESCSEALEKVYAANRDID
jgi:hypothetical protein